MLCCAEGGGHKQRCIKVFETFSDYTSRNVGDVAHIFRRFSRADKSLARPES